MPTWRRRYRASPVSLSVSIRSPATVTEPLVGRSSPAIRFSSVDLPLPDGPITATASPGATSRLTPATAAWPRVALGDVAQLVSSVSMPGTLGRAGPGPRRPGR